MRRRLLAAFAAVLAFAAPPLEAQQTTCSVRQRDGAPDATFSNVGTPYEVAIVPLADLSCAGGRRILADTAMVSQASGMIQLFGRVEVTDPEQTLRARQVTYYTRVRQMTAFDNVVLTSRRNGSVIRSDVLNYYEQTAQRPQSMIVATRQTGPLVRAILYDDQPSVEGARPDSMIVDAQEIHITGDDNFRGIGNATLTRDSLTATGHQIEYWQNVGSLNVLGGGVVTLPGYDLRGDSITATMAGEQREIREVLTRHDAALTSEDMNVRAPAIRLFFENGGIARMVAMNWRPMGATPAGARPVAVSEQFRMESDSIDVLAPDQKITEAAAIGSAYVQRFTPDSLRALLPDAEPEVLALIENDWMRGDTVRAFFTDAPVDTAGAGSNERVMERLTAVGAAQAMHRMRPEDAATDAKLSIAYLVGRSVQVSFGDGVVTEVQASEDVRGVYLQPRDAARQAGDEANNRRRGR